MITNIKGEGFKGLQFDQALETKTMFIGKNGSGKSARSAAISLLCLGYIPGSAKADKTNADILANFAGGRDLRVEGRIGGQSFGRRFTASKTGATIRQLFYQNGRQVKRDDWIKAMARAPRVLDLNADFLELSDQKKIDHLFALYPPAGDLQSLEADIETLTEKLNLKQREIRDKESLVQQLSQARANIQLPAGTQAEIQAEIENVTSQRRQTAVNLENARVRSAAQRAAEKAKAENDAKAARQPGPPPITHRPAQAPPVEHPLIPPQVHPNPANIAAAEKLARSAKQPEAPANIPRENAAASINRIIQAAQKVRADYVVMVCKLELKRFMPQERKAA